MRKTKIICTLGPSSKDEAVMREMLLAGMNVARLNFSHGTHESHGMVIDTFRRVRNELGLAAAVVMDTKGPEIRLGTFQKPVIVKEGQTYVFTTEKIQGDEHRCSISYIELPRQIKPGDTILVNDGAMAFRVESHTDRDITCIAEKDGEMKDRKGVNVPGVILDRPYIGEKDEADLLYGIEKKVDYVAASFVRKKDDVVQLRAFLDSHGGQGIRIIAKIENQEGIDHFSEILRACDGIMVARGDMGVEVAFEKLPGIQKKFIRQCYQSGKISITATQMLESMIENRMPTRAEITDVANAVFDGTSAVMLSGETANGANPVEAVKVMARILERAERDASETGAFEGITHLHDITDVTNAISAAACTTADQLKAKAIIADTKTGTAARRVAKFRPPQTIVAATPMAETFHQMSIVWGVYPLLTGAEDDVEFLFRRVIASVKDAGLAEYGDAVVITAGLPLNVEGRTNMLRVQYVE